MSQTTRKVAGMPIAKKKVVWKYSSMRRCLVRSSPDQSVSPAWSRRVYCVIEPATAAIDVADNQRWYFLDGGATVESIVTANNTGALEPREV